MTQAQLGLPPTLGVDLVDWIQDDAELVHGAGSVQGQRVDWSKDTDRLGVIYRAYELIPVPQCPSCLLWHDVPAGDYLNIRGGRFVGWVCPGKKCGAPLPPMRAWSHYKLSAPKGWSKSGLASKLVVAEACGPVLFDGWSSTGEPVGRPHRRPVVNCFATEEGQAGETYGAAAIILQHLATSRWPRRTGYRIDPGVSKGEKSTRAFIHTPFGTVGLVQPRTSADTSAEGGQGTFAVADETHLWIRRELKALYETEIMNLGKGADSVGWVLETSTMYRPGENSVAEESDRAAQEAGTESGIYVDHRGASDDVDVWKDRDRHVPDREKLEQATREAYRDSFVWAVSMPERIRLFSRTNLDQSELERKYLNRKSQQGDAFIFRPTWMRNVADDLEPDWVPDDDEHCVFGLDGSLTDDHTGLVGVHVPTATLFVAGHWNPADYKTEDYPEGHVPEEQVDDTVRDAFRRWGITRFYPDPPHWRSWVAEWSRRHGDKVVKPFETARKARMSPALKAFDEAVRTGALRHTGHQLLTEHLTRAVKVVEHGREDPELNPDGKWWRIKKPKQTKRDEDNKIDLGVCAVLAWAAYLDTVAGDEQPPKRRKGRVMRIR